MDYKSLQELKEKYINEINFRKNIDTSKVDYKYDVMVCGGTGCRSCKSKLVQEKLTELVKEKGLEKDIKIHGVGCFGLCVNGPIVLVLGGNSTHNNKIAIGNGNFVNSLLGVFKDDVTLLSVNYN